MNKTSKEKECLEINQIFVTVVFCDVTPISSRFLGVLTQKVRTSLAQAGLSLELPESL